MCVLRKSRRLNAVSSPMSLGIDVIPLEAKEISVVVDTGKDSGTLSVSKDTCSSVGESLGDELGCRLGTPLGIWLG